MIFLLDENFPKPAIPILATHGHSAIDVRGTGQEGASDSSLFRLAQDRGAILLTTDKDFFHTVPLTFPRHCGSVVIALDQPNRAAILAKLVEALRYIEHHDIANRSLLLTDRKMYLR
jgi:predicted nuclease of predicted toxin-antitoxin system